MSKTTKSKTRKSKTAMPKELSVRAAQEFALLAFYAGIGFGRRLDGRVTFKFRKNALQAWLKAQTKSMHQAIDVRGLKSDGLLEKARKTAGRLGTELAVRTNPAPVETNPAPVEVTINKKKVAEVVELFRKCRPGGGGGAYCAIKME